MPEILTVKLAKGGTGKTTTVVHLGQILAKEHNKKVLIVDLDAQATLSKIFLRDEYDSKNFTKKLISANLLARDYSSKEEIIHPIHNNLDLIRAGRGLTEVIFYLKSNHAETYLTSLRETLLEDFAEYDYILLDVNPGVGDDISEMTYITADCILVPTELTTPSIDGIVETYQEIHNLREQGLTNLKSGNHLVIIPNKYNQIYKGENERILSSLRESLGEIVADPIRQNANYNKAYSDSITAIDFEMQLLDDFQNKIREGKIRSNDILSRIKFDENDKNKILNLHEFVETKAIDDFRVLAEKILKL